MDKTRNFKYRVSSVLNDDNCNYGKKHLFDGDEITCWSSHHGVPQWIELLFDEEQDILGFKIQFQGGFAGKDCQIDLYPFKPAATNDIEAAVVHPFYPEDKNALQEFWLESCTKTKYLRVLFKNSSDTFGRIIIYQFIIIFKDS